jgi:hypothetical protein
MQRRWNRTGLKVPKNADHWCSELPAHHTTSSEKNAVVYGEFMLSKAEQSLEYVPCYAFLVFLRLSAHSAPVQLYPVRDTATRPKLTCNRVQMFASSSGASSRPRGHAMTRFSADGFLLCRRIVQPKLKLGTADLRVRQRWRLRRLRSAGPQRQQEGYMLLDGFFRQFQSVVEGLRRLAPLSDATSAPPVKLRLRKLDPTPELYNIEEEGLVPLVLVAGATGRTGRLVVRKLLLQGFRVRALVRDLRPETLDELGTGCEYAKADLLDKDSVLEALYGVDKVICVVSDEAERETEAITNLIRAFQDARFLEFGRKDSAKITIFKFNKPRHFALWARPENLQTAVVKAYQNEVGGVDQLLQDNNEDQSAPVMPQAAMEESGRLRDPLSSTFFQLNDFGNAVFHGKIRDIYRGQAEVFTTSFARKPLNFQGFSGLILRCLGDGQRYSLIIRTKSGDRAGIQFISTFSTTPSRKWITLRFSFPDFIPQRTSDGALLQAEIRDASVYDFSEITQIGFLYEARNNLSIRSLSNPGSRKGTFMLTLDYMKAFRTQDEPEFVLVSCMGTHADMEEISRKRSIEDALKAGGLSYCIIRTGVLTDEPGGVTSITFDQSQIQGRGLPSGVVVSEIVRTPFTKKISRADVADVCVASLLDARACNVTFNVFSSAYAPTTRIPTRNYSALFETLKPNT